MKYNTYQSQRRQSNAPNQDNDIPRNEYANRYRRTVGTSMDRIFSLGPPIVAFVSFLITLASFIAMLLVDLYIGRYIATYMANEDVGTLISFATTCLVIAMIGTGLYGYRESWSPSLTISILLLALAPVSVDIYFDCMSVDIIRYGHYIDVTTLPLAEQVPHKLFRALVGTLSAISEPLTASSVIIFPVLREIFKGVLNS